MSPNATTTVDSINSTVALAAFMSTALISIAPNVLLLLFPQYASGEGEHSFVLSLGQAIAAGGLLGDVFLHVIPHSAAATTAAVATTTSSSSSPHHDHDHSSSMGLWILLGFGLFLITDMALRQLSNSTTNNNCHIGHSHKAHDNNNTHNTHNNDKNINDDQEEVKINSKSSIHDHSENKHKKSLVLLNLVADALHNFTDGLAIGASFSRYSGKSTDTMYQIMVQSSGGLATTMSILFHEIPHELGDFAILVKQGYSKQQAIMAQFGTALAAMMGTYVGLMLSMGHDAIIAQNELLLVTAGGFVYLATVNILPELLDEPNRSLKQRLIQLVFFAMGIGLLYAVSLLEEMDHDGHHHHHHHHIMDDHHHHHDTHNSHHDSIHDHSHHHHQSHDYGNHHDHGHHHDHGEL